MLSLYLRESLLETYWQKVGSPVVANYNFNGYISVSGKFVFIHDRRRRWRRTTRNVFLSMMTCQFLQLIVYMYNFCSSKLS